MDRSPSDGAAEMILISSICIGNSWEIQYIQISLAIPGSLMVVHFFGLQYAHVWTMFRVFHVSFSLDLVYSFSYFLFVLTGGVPATVGCFLERCVFGRSIILHLKPQLG